MSVDAERRALASDIEHWIGRLANTRTGSPQHRDAARELLGLVVGERVTILASLRTPPSGLGGDGGAEAMRERCAKLCEEEARDQHHIAVAHLEYDTEASATAYGAEEAAKTLAAEIRAMKLPDPSPDQGEGGRPHTGLSEADKAARAAALADAHRREHEERERRTLQSTSTGSGDA